MHPHTKLKLDIMEALKSEPMSIYQLSPRIADLAVKASHIAKALDELVTDGFLVRYEVSSTVGHVYKHASEHSLSDLSAMFLPHRDPVREAHAYEATQGRNRVFRYEGEGGADLGEDD